MVVSVAAKAKGEEGWREEEGAGASQKPRLGLGCESFSAAAMRGAVIYSGQDDATPPTPAPAPTVDSAELDDPASTTPMPRYNAMLAILRNMLYMSVPSLLVMIPAYPYYRRTQIRRHIRARCARIYS